VSISFRVNISTENAAFDGDARNHETARILRRIADRLDAGESMEFYETLLDSNGNDVGRCAFKPDEPRPEPTRRRRVKPSRPLF
jgi:hypothetical protein